MQWAAYEQVTGPLSLHERLDYLFATLMATIVNVNKRKGQPAARPTDFIPNWDGRKPQMDPMTMRQNLYAATARR